jgi:cell division protein FtsB
MKSSNKNLANRDSTSIPSKKGKNANKARRRITFILLYAIFLGYGAYQILFVQYAQISSLRKQQEILRENIAQEVEKNETLTEEYSLGNTDDVVERIAREKLGLIMPDEKIYVDQSRN